MSTELATRDDDETAIVQTDSGSVLEALTRGEIDSQVRTAKAFPRDIKRFKAEAISMACLDEDTATSCIYALPRGGKSIEGPSARLAEIVASAWGNCRAGARVISEDDRFVTAQGFFFDVQRNYAVTFEVRRRITNSKGQRFNDDMIAVTSNAACSIALRNAVFKGVPKAFWSQAYEEARRTSVGDAKTIETKRATMIEYFGKMGIQPERICAALGVPSVENIDIDQMATLKGVATALKEGEVSIEQAFPATATPAVVSGPVSVDSILNAKASTSTAPAKLAKRGIKIKNEDGEDITPPPEVLNVPEGV